ncbi:MAG TPA: hypothetical protein VKG62_02770 [Solirubrobacteraceae bacterium]|nr:hypothetical protein [Solirubrobacteraceae bacterium]
MNGIRGNRLIRATTMRTRLLAPLGTLIFASLALAGTAQAASPPSVSTGGPRNVSYASATLTGSVNPHGVETSFYFQYGATKIYGGQTTIASAGAGTRAVSVSLPVTGLQPLSVYHYRLVAVNGAGPSIGRDRTLVTTKVPLSLAILVAPDPIVYGGAITVEGTLSGTDNANRPVVLQGDSFPYTAGFQNVGNPELTTAVGGFSFPVLGLATLTQFRVVTTTSPPVVSPVALANVAVRITPHVGRASRPNYLRIYGTVSPASTGTRVEILRIVHGHAEYVAGTFLRSLTATSSRFSRAIPARRGVYRVFVKVTDGAQLSNYSSFVLIG